MTMASSLEVVWGSEGRLGGEERKEFLRMPVGLELNGLRGGKRTFWPLWGGDGAGWGYLGHNSSCVGHSYKLAIWLSDYEVGLMRWVEHECYVVLCWRWRDGVSEVACGPVGRCNSSYADLISTTLVYIW